MKIIGLRVEKYIDKEVSEHNCNFEYQDAEFEIVGLSEGLRDEDMCFVCVTDKGIEFKAKPMGNRELKQQYREDLDSLIGKMATVKFFYLSDEGTPLQPVLKCIRDYD